MLHSSVESLRPGRNAGENLVAVTSAVPKPKGHPNNIGTGVSMVNVTLTLKIIIYPLDEIFGGISAGSLDFRTLQWRITGFLCFKILLTPFLTSQPDRICLTTSIFLL
jgi:hypothetical protein